MKPYIFLFCAGLLVPGLAHAGDDCDFAPPEPLLKSHAYAGQTFRPQPDQQAIETATLGGGVKLTITHGGCVDTVGRDYVLTVPNDPKRQGFVAWTDFTRDTLRTLKLRQLGWMTTLIDFLKTARTMKPKNGVVAMCANGTLSDDCNWDSGGSLRIEVKPGAKTTRITVTETVSG